MVKIVEEKPDPSVVKRVVCRNCGRKIEYLPVDVQHRDVTDYGGGSDRSYFIVCPGCNINVTVRP